MATTTEKRTARIITSEIYGGRVIVVPTKTARSRIGPWHVDVAHARYRVGVSFAAALIAGILFAAFLYWHAHGGPYEAVVITGWSAAFSLGQGVFRGVAYLLSDDDLDGKP